MKSPVWEASAWADDSSKSPTEGMFNELANIYHQITRSNVYPRTARRGMNIARQTHMVPDMRLCRSGGVVSAPCSFLSISSTLVQSAPWGGMVVRKGTPRSSSFVAPWSCFRILAFSFATISRTPGKLFTESMALCKKPGHGDARRDGGEEGGVGKLGKDYDRTTMQIARCV